MALRCSSLTTVGLMVVLGLVSMASAELSCKDMDGKDVDWFVALKLPKITKKYDAKNPHIKDGMAFWYADANNQEFRLSPLSINDPKSAIGATVSQAIDARRTKSKDSFWIFYNDQHPGKKTVGNRAHAKGVMSFNMKQGFWLKHSSPRFNDPSKGKYEYPITATKYGQSYICGTFNSDQLAEISEQVHVSHWSVYDYGMPSEFAAKWPKMLRVVGEATIDKSCKQWRNTALKTKAGFWFRSFEKNQLAHSELYANQVGPDLKTSLFVETWLNGAEKDYQSSCGAPFTKNNKRIAPGGIEYASASDHSKWAVSSDASKPWVCIGDINRQESQEHRGGGTLCLKHPKIWDFFRKAIVKVECCPGEKGDCEPMPSNSVAAPKN